MIKEAYPRVCVCPSRFEMLTKSENIRRTHALYGRINLLAKAVVTGHYGGVDRGDRAGFVNGGGCSVDSHQRGADSALSRWCSRARCRRSWTTVSSPGRT